MRNEHIAKKRFGQNFLQDIRVLEQIIEAMPDNDNALAEIGPGLGDLTKYLVDVKALNAFEVDTDLCRLLRDRFKDAIATDALTLHCGDVLESWKISLLDRRYDLVANLPYYIATNIILKALADPLCQTIIVMVQKEVAYKFAARCGAREFGALSVITQSVAKAKIVANVPPEAFDPPPKVDSSVILIEKFADRSDVEFERFLRIAFKQPRKTLAKNLSARYDKKEISDAFAPLALAMTVRPHQVKTSDYHQLYKTL